MATIFRTDEIYWYDPPGAPWGQLGFACPNFGDNPTALNNDALYIVDVVGRNLQAIMLHQDVDLRRPPSINTLTRVHKLIIRARSILASRAVPENKQRFEAQHATPAPRPFMIFPCPYWNVRNAWLKEWGGLILDSLSEAMQHTAARLEHEITMDFAGLVGQYFHRVYKRMATELFGVPLAEAEKPDFTLTDAQLGSYDPSKWFTSTEMIDLAPPLHEIPTEDDLQILTDGIPATQLVGLKRWPAGPAPSASASEAAGAFYHGQPAVAGTGGTLAGSFAPPPGP